MARAKKAKKPIFPAILGVLVKKNLTKGIFCFIKEVPCVEI